MDRPDCHPRLPPQIASEDIEQKPVAWNPATMLEDTTVPRLDMGSKADTSVRPQIHPLLLCRFAFHASHPVGAVLGKFELHGVGSRGKHLHSETAFHRLSAHVLVAVPCPGVAVNCSGCTLGFAHAVERGVGINLLLGVVTENGVLLKLPHIGHVSVSMLDQEKISFHPLG